MRKLFLVVGLVAAAQLAAQSIGQDLQRVVRLAPVARTAAGPDNPALDTIVLTLAYYAGMPDTAEVGRLLSGPELLFHYRDNPPVQDFLLAEELYGLLENYAPPAGLAPTAEMRSARRTGFLRRLPGDALFSTDGRVDLTKIRRTFGENGSAPPDLGKVAAAANDRQADLSSAGLVGTALAGLSDWITRRAQEELTYTFLTGLREDLRKNDLHYLFPSTAGFLPELDLLNYRAILPSIRRAFVSDLNDIAYHLGNYLAHRRPAVYHDPAVYNLFLVYRLLDLTMREVPLTDILAFTYGELTAARANVRRELELELAAADPEGAGYARVLGAFDAYNAALNGTADSSAFAVAVAPELQRVDNWLAESDRLLLPPGAPELARYDLLYGTNATALRPASGRAAGLTAVREVLARGPERPTGGPAFALRAAPDPAHERDRLVEDLEASLERDDAPATRMLLEIARAVDTSATNVRAQLTGLRERLTELDGEPATDGFGLLFTDRVEDAREELRTTVRDYSAAAPDTLVRAYRNLTTFSTLFGLAQEVFFLLSDAHSSGTGYFLPNRELGRFYTEPTAHRLLQGVATDRIGRVSELGAISPAGLSQMLLDFGLYLSEYRDRGWVPEVGDSFTEERRIQAVDFITRTLATLLETPILVDPLDPERTLPLAAHHPAFSRVGPVGRELSDLFRLSQTGEYRYAVDNLLNLLQLFDLVPSASKRRQRLLDRQRELEEVLANHAIEESEELRAIALVPPSTAELPLLGDRRDAGTLSRYQAQLTLETDAYGREEISNSIRDLKIQRLRGALQRVNGRLEKLRPERHNRFREDLFRYGAFMADVAAADSPAGFEAALSTVALPPGSSQIKRTRPSSFELGAYFGIAGSRERLTLPTNVEAPNLPTEAWGVALFVPVGISYSKRIGGGNSSLTLFGSLLDLGALTAFRFGGDEDVDGARVERFPQFRPLNVVAPGLHLMYNFPKSPFTFGLGAQDGPSVRDFTVAGDPKVREARAVRFMATLSIDVPIFRFFNR